MKFAEEEKKNRVFFFFCKVIVIKVKIKGQQRTYNLKKKLKKRKKD